MHHTVGRQMTVIRNDEVMWIKEEAVVSRIFFLE
jgi:hypothetical protein